MSEYFADGGARLVRAVSHIITDRHITTLLCSIVLSYKMATASTVCTATLSPPNLINFPSGSLHCNIPNGSVIASYSSRPVWLVN